MEVSFQNGEKIRLDWETIATTPCDLGEYLEIPGLTIKQKIVDLRQMFETLRKIGGMPIIFRRAVYAGYRARFERKFSPIESISDSEHQKSNAKKDGDVRDVRKGVPRFFRISQS